MARLLLDERILRDGRRASTWAQVVDGMLQVIDDDGTSGQLSAVAIERVMVRYGRPLDPKIVLDGAALDVGDNRLRRLRYHAPIDAEGRDYLVWEQPNEPPVAVLAAHATAALRYLVMRLGAERTPGG